MFPTVQNTLFGGRKHAQLWRAPDTASEEIATDFAPFLFVLRLACEDSENNRNSLAARVLVGKSGNSRVQTGSDVEKL